MDIGKWISYWIGHINTTTQISTPIATYKWHKYELIIYNK